MTQHPLAFSCSFPLVVFSSCPRSFIKNEKTKNRNVAVLVTWINNTSLRSSRWGLTPPLSLLLFYFSVGALPLRNVCITKTQICCYSKSSRCTAHSTHTSRLQLSSPLKNDPLQFSIRKWLLENLGSKDFPPVSIPPLKHWSGPAFFRGSVGSGVLGESPEDRSLDRGLETPLLETEVLWVDLSIWMSTMGFCTSRKRWKGLCSSPCG